MITDPAQTDALSKSAREHLWMHFTRLSSYGQREVPVIVRGEGAWVWDDHGRKYLDGRSGLLPMAVRGCGTSARWKTFE